MDGVSAVASVVALIEISVKVASLCAEYYSYMKSAEKDIDQFHLEVKALIKVLQNLYQLAQKPGAAKLFTLNALGQYIKSCKSELTHIKERLEPGNGQKTMSRIGIRALKWPFENKELAKVMNVLGRYKSIFSIALNVDQT
ncbi:MAG: vegetative incompatibility HET-E-1 [Lasallia pustulata]|uniref:Vegetative incompatibility HET-E-1 n=1 Tax=Lasallia pustulata TaxID=136370 RepID=A0A5M8PT50_9LECA|nr:MAG: vegetative incompatibility HET-E-1 [Lasallia pustulata]